MIQLSGYYSNSSKQPLTYESLNKFNKPIAHQSVLERFITLFHFWSSILDFQPEINKIFFSFFLERMNEIGECRHLDNRLKDIVVQRILKISYFA